MKLPELKHFETCFIIILGQNISAGLEIGEET
jgi:hypothetical protein